MKIIITVYTGFVGINLALQLSKKILYGVDLIQKDSDAKLFRWEA